MDDTVSRQAVLNVLDEIEAQYVFDDGHDRMDDLISRQAAIDAEDDK